jgi:hypothetical protein
MNFYQLLVTLTELLLKAGTLPTNLYPVKLQITDAANINITNTYFGITELTVDSTFWTVSYASLINTTTVNNTLDITFGTALADYTSPIKLRIFTNSGVLIADQTLDVTIETGSDLILYAGSGISFSLKFGGRGLQEFVLKTIFKNTGAAPANFYLALVNSLAAEQTRYAMIPSRWSNQYINNLGQASYEYGETKTLTLASQSIVKKFVVYDAASSGVVWFTGDIGLPSTEKSGSIIYSNSVKLNLVDTTVTNYAPGTNTASLLHINFNGHLFDVADSVQPLSFSDITFNAVEKLFGTECVIGGATSSLSYTNINIPSTFTLQTFVKFSSSASGRTILFFNKLNVLKLEKTGSNNLELSVNGSVVMSVPWLPVSNAWQHIWIQKKATTLQLRVNSADINTSISYSTAVTNTTQNTVLLLSTAPLLGASNGVYLSSDDSLSFTAFASITMPNAYNVKELDFNHWINSNASQITGYFA